MDRIEPLIRIATLKKRKRRGFTLVELLGVMAIIAILGFLTVPALSSLSAGKLTEGGNMVVSLANQARQNAMSTSHMTALVMVNSSSNSDWNGRLFTLLDLTPGSTTWTPLSKWYRLPSAVMVDPSQSTFVTQQAALPGSSAGFGSLSFNGSVIDPASCVYQVFMPTGQISVQGISSAASPPNLRVTAEVNSQPSTSGKDFYNVTLNLYTGIPIVNRP